MTKIDVVDTEPGVRWTFATAGGRMSSAAREDGTTVSIPIPYKDLRTLNHHALRLLVSDPEPRARLNSLAAAHETTALELILADLDHRKAVDDHGDDGLTPLFRVVLQSDPLHRLPLVKVLIEAGANPYVMQDFPAIAYLYRSPYNHALKNRDSKLFAYLLHSRHINVERLYLLAQSDETSLDDNSRELRFMHDVLKQHIKDMKLADPEPRVQPSTRTT